MGKQTCKDCAGRGWIAGPLYALEGSYKCPTCDDTGSIYRTGPYRLMNGEWSDGVDRARVIPAHEFSKANPDRVYVHGTWDQDDLGRWKPYFDVWRGDTCIKTGWPFAEAIAYADRMARRGE